MRKLSSVVVNITVTIKEQDRAANVFIHSTHFHTVGKYQNGCQS